MKFENFLTKHCLESRSCATEKLGIIPRLWEMVSGGGVSKGRTTMATEQIRFSISFQRGDGSEREESVGRKAVLSVTFSQRCSLGE